MLYDANDLLELLVRPVKLARGAGPAAVLDAQQQAGPQPGEQEEEQQHDEQAAGREGRQERDEARQQEGAGASGAEGCQPGPEGEAGSVGCGAHLPAGQRAQALPAAEAPGPGDSLAGDAAGAAAQLGAAACCRQASRAGSPAAEGGEEGSASGEAGAKSAACPAQECRSSLAAGEDGEEEPGPHATRSRRSSSSSAQLEHCHPHASERQPSAPASLQDSPRQHPRHSHRHRQRRSSSGSSLGSTDSSDECRSDSSSSGRRRSERRSSDSLRRHLQRAWLQPSLLGRVRAPGRALLQALFADLAPAYRQVGLDDGQLPGFAAQRQQLSELVCVSGATAAARALARRGLLPGQRAQVWPLALGLQKGAADVQQLEFELLCRWGQRGHRLWALA
jgi:hypothetical protein